MDRGRPTAVEPWRRPPLGGQTLAVKTSSIRQTPLSIVTKPTPGNLSPSPEPSSVSVANSARVQLRWDGGAAPFQQQQDEIRRQESGDAAGSADEAEPMTPAKSQVLPAFQIPINPAGTSQDTVLATSSSAKVLRLDGLDSSRTLDGQNSPSRRPLPPVPRDSPDDDSGVVTMGQFRQLSEEQFATMQRVFRDQVHQLHQVIDDRLQGVATRRMLDDHATLGMLNQLSAACEARFKMLESDWALQGQRLLRVEANCSSQEQLHSELEQQVRRMTLSQQGELVSLPHGEELVGLLEGMQRDLGLLRSSQEAASGELIQHRAELMILHGQNPGAAQAAAAHALLKGSPDVQQSQPLCSSCGNMHLARAQFCRICGKKRDDVSQISGQNTPTRGGALDTRQHFEDLDARLRGLEANMSTALNQRRNESAELSLQVEAINDHVRLLEGTLQSLQLDVADDGRTLPGTQVNGLSTADSVFSQAQDRPGKVVTLDMLNLYATKTELTSVSSACKVLESNVDVQIAEIQGRVEEVFGSVNQDVASLNARVSELLQR